MKTLVIGGTGTVGALLVENLVRRGIEPRVMVRSASRVSLVPTGANAVIGNLVADPQGAAAAFQGIEAVFMLNPPSENETIEGLIAVELARSAGVRRFVYQSCHRLEEMAHLPHLGAKLAISHAVAKSGMDYTFVCPNHFFQNDIRLRTELTEQGRFAEPLGGIGVWGVDARDIAEAAAIVLTSDGHTGQSYNLVGPENITGESRAAIWAEALSRTVTYVDDPDTWRAGLWPGIPGWLVFDLTLMYGHFAKSGMPGTPGEVERLTRLLGHSPRSFKAFARECAIDWQTAAN